MAAYSARMGEPVTTDTATIHWMDWHGPDVLKLLTEEDPRVGKIDSIYWNVTDSEQFEKVKRSARGTVLCVTGKHPDDEVSHVGG